MSLYLLAQLFDEEPGLGYRLPYGHPRRPHPDFTAPLPETVPSYEARALIAAATDAVRLYQLACRIGGEIQAPLLKFANKLYEHSGCAAYGAAELFRLIFSHSPPPPSQPVRLVESLALLYAAETLASDTSGNRPVIPYGIIEALVESLLGPPQPAEKGGSKGTGDPNSVCPILPPPKPVPEPSAPQR